MKEFTKKQSGILIAISIIILIIPLFYKINEEPLKRWDESLYALVAYDLAYHGKALQAWSDFQGQNYNEPVTKPKTLFWMQAGFMKIFGYDSKLAIRLPSILATILLIAFLISYCYRRYDSLLLGIFTSMVLITIRAYMFHHVARSGDFDAFLLLFSTMGILFYFDFIKNSDNPQSYKYLLLTGACFAGAVLFKNIAGLFMLPGLLLYTLYKKKLLIILKSKYLYYTIALFFIIIIPYYLFEAFTFPNFFRELWNHEIGGRYGGVIDRNQHPFYYYFQYLFTTGNHAPWVLFIPLTIGLVFADKDSPFKDLVIFALIMTFTFLALISFAETKIRWYVAPTYPLLALLTGISLYYLFRYVTSKVQGALSRFALMACFGLALVFPSYLDILQGITAYKEEENDCGFHYDVYEECFKKINTEDLNYKELVVYRDSTDWWIPQLLFYRNVYNDLYNFNIQISEDPMELRNHENVVVCYSHMPDIQELYQYKVLLKFKEIQLIKLEGVID